MNALLESLHAFVNWLLSYPFVRSLLASPRRLAIYAAISAVLLIGIPVLRFAFRSRSKADEEDVSGDAAYPSVLGLAAPVDLSSPPRFAPSSVPIEPSVPAPMSNVTPINQALTVPCIHCGITMSSRQDFCPACGYAQPMKRSVTA